MRRIIAAILKENPFIIWPILFKNHENFVHCVKSVQIRSYFWPVFSCIRTEYGPKINPYLDTFQAAMVSVILGGLQEILN